MNTFAVSFANFAADVAFSFDTDIFIISVSFSCVTVMLFFNSSSLMFIPTLEITSLIMLLLCTSALYVDTTWSYLHNRFY